MVSTKKEQIAGVGQLLDLFADKHGILVEVDRKKIDDAQSFDAAVDLVLSAISHDARLMFALHQFAKSEKERRGRNMESIFDYPIKYAASTLANSLNKLIPTEDNNEADA